MIRVFATGRHPIMTGTATADDIAVIDGEYWRETIRCMTVLASVGGCNMRRVFAGRVCAVVARDTVADDIGVIEHSR